MAMARFCRSVYHLLFTISLCTSLSYAAIAVDPSCAQKAASVNDALREAFEMAQNVVVNGAAQDARTVGLFFALMGTDRQYDARAVNAIAGVANYAVQPPTLTIYCDDTFIVQHPVSLTQNDWWDVRNPNAPVLVSSAVANTFSNCAVSGFLGYAILPGVIILCPKAFGRGPGGVDIIGGFRNTVQAAPLDSYNILSGTIFHELAHIAGQGNVIDWTLNVQLGAGPAYGYQACVSLAHQTAFGGVKAPNNADSLTLLAVGNFRPRFLNTKDGV
ncbi:hypothetical protein MMC21_004908 [Puttea exsequens]|nr:hypothetical protein [Puttea exsequens]